MLIDLKVFPKENGIYKFLNENNEVIYIGSTINLYRRMAGHNACIKAGSDHGRKQDFYKFLNEEFYKIEFEIVDNYREKEQLLIEELHPVFNLIRATTYLGVRKNRNSKYNKQYREKYKDRVSFCKKQWYEKNKKKMMEKSKEKRNRKCLYNGEVLSFRALCYRLKNQGADHPTKEAEKYLIN